jgi:hypothetical protein
MAKDVHRRDIVVGNFFSASAALAANPGHSADFLPSCLQTAKEDLGSVVPGPSSLNLPAVCYRATSTSASLNLSGPGGWRDAGAMSR